MKRSDLCISESTVPPDFNCYPVSTKADMIDWPVTRRDIIGKVADDPIHEHQLYEERSLGRNKAALMRMPDGTSLDCSFIVHRALSWHREYSGSSLEMMGSLECEYRQGWDGAWTGNNLSFIMSTLERFNTPVAALTLLRSVPLLIRQQDKDGCWVESPKPPQHILRQTPITIPALPKETTTFLILRALKKFGFLEALLPKS